LAALLGGLVLGLLGLAALTVGEGTTQAAPPALHEGARGSVHFAATGNHSEIRETVPIARRKWAKKRVVMSLGPGKLPTLKRGDILRTSGEVKVSNTCILFSALSCIGVPYRFSPRDDARIVLAGGRRTTGGRRAMAIAGADGLRCRQRLPDRNHHCVLVFPPAATKVRDLRRLPCRPAACHLNLVLQTDFPRARRGQVALVGADRPDGTVRQDGGRLNAIVLRGKVPPAKKYETRQRVSRSVPIAPRDRAGRRAIYSQRINRLHKGDVLEVKARHRITISSLPYNSFIGTHLILTHGPHAVAPNALARRAIGGRGEVTEANGFNCTHGPSAYRDPCVTKKAGGVQIRQSVARHGHPVPLYLNVVVAGGPKRAIPRPSDRMRVLRGGWLQIRRYRAP
jgi:hypothetical protein